MKNCIKGLVRASGRLRHTVLREALVHRTQGEQGRVVPSLYQIRSSQQRFLVISWPLRRKLLGNVEKYTKRKCTKFACSQGVNSCVRDIIGIYMCHNCYSCLSDRGWLLIDASLMPLTSSSSPIQLLIPHSQRDAISSQFKDRMAANRPKISLIS